MVNVILTLRIVQAVLAIIVLGLACYVVDFYNRTGVSIDAANFLVFNVCAFSPFITFFPSSRVGLCAVALEMVENQALVT